MNVSLTKEQATELLRRRIRRGARFLDQQVPNWWQRIHLSLLDLGTCQQCILGQLFGKFDKGLEALAFPLRDMRRGARFGFNGEGYRHPISRAVGYDWPTYVILTDLWREEVERRVTSFSAKAEPGIVPVRHQERKGGRSGKHWLEVEVCA